jgi:hypothetical protein
VDEHLFCCSTIPESEDPEMKIAHDTPAGEIDFSSSVLGADLVLTERADRRLVLHTFDGHRARLLGTFDDAAAAWRAIDALDIDELALAA